MHGVLCLTMAVRHLHHGREPTSADRQLPRRTGWIGDFFVAISTCGEHSKGIFDCQRICRQRSTLLRFSVLAIMFVEFGKPPTSPTVEFAEVLFPQ